MSSTLSGPTGRTRSRVQPLAWLRRTGSPQRDERWWGALSALVLAALTVFLSFQNGGYFAGSSAVATGVLVAVLLVRLVAAPRPIAGLTTAGLVGAAALLGLCLLAVLSSAWSDDREAALLEASRTLGYLAAFGLFAVTARGTNSARWLLRLLGLALAVLVVAGLLSRLLPDVVHTAQAEITGRLTGPVGYHNGFGLACALLIAIGLGTASDRTEAVGMRAVGAALVPLGAAGLYLTLSRGAMVAGIAGLVLLLALRPGRGLVSLLAAGLPAAATLLVVTAADALTTKDITSSIAVEQGRRAAIAVAAGMLLAAALQLLAVVAEERWTPRRRIGRRRGWSAVAAAVVVGAVVATLLGAPAIVSEQWDRATRPDTDKPLTNGAARLFDPGLNGRIEHWRVSLEAFGDRPLLGTGAGTFEQQWDLRRSISTNVRDGHSLYLETLGELGAVGVGLLALALLVPLVQLIRRRRENAVWTAVLPVVAVWLVHAGVDWDWELPAVTLGVVALLGAACARRAGPTGSPRAARLLIGVVLLGMLIMPTRIGWSQRQLVAALDAFQRGNCATTVDRSLAAAAALNSRPQAFELLGYCDVRLGRSELATEMMRRAVVRSPGDWELLYGAAIVGAAAGDDPRALLRRARGANPLEPLVTDAQRAFSGSRRRRWSRVALTLQLPGPTGDQRGAAP